MTDFFVQHPGSEPIKVDIVPQPIVSVEHFVPAPPPAPPSSTDDLYPRRFGNERLNSRVEVSVPQHGWEVHWKVPLDRYFAPNLLLWSGQRILLQGSDLWQLFNDEGTLLAMNHIGESEVIISPEHSHFYLLNRSGYLAAYRIDDGAIDYEVAIPFGDHFGRPYMVRRGSRLFVLGVQRQLQPHTYPPNRSHIDILDFGNPERIDNVGLLSSLKVHATLITHTTQICTALNDETVVIATPNSLHIADLDLKIRRAFTSEFVPLAMSLDETGRIYLISRTVTEEGTARNALWVLTSEGERVIDVEISDTFGEVDTPPIVGYDHHVYVLSETQLLAIAPDGQELWHAYAGAQIAGAVVTAENQLVVCAGNVVWAFDDTGERRAIHFFENETLRTQPVLTAKGKLLVATENHLYCLTPPK